MAPSGATSPSIILTAPVTTRNNRKTTASKPLLAISKSIEEHTSGTGIRTDITNSSTARKLLNTHGLFLPIAGKALNDIAIALFEFSASANIGATNTEIVRALAFILHEAEQSINIEKVIDKINALIMGPIALLDEKVDTLAEIATTHKTAIEETVTKVRNQFNKSSEEIGRMVEQATTKANQSNQPSTTPARSNGSLTYAETAKADIPRALTKILARSEAQARQILIDRRSPLIANSLKELTEAQLVTKATTALELMEQQGIEKPADLTFISARRLPHGGILYELNSKASADWFHNPANRSNFIEYYASNVTVKEKSFHVLVENVPISFAPESPAATAEVEKKAGLQPKSISKAKYIKPVARRHQNQRTAHVVITFTTKASANQAIKFGLAIEGKKVYGRKLLPEPTRCLKCHSFDGAHIAADCPQEHDTCGSCGEQHRTAQCPEEDPTKYACKNCQTKGHPAWSRECPTFVQKWDAHKRRNDEAKYIFFPTDDPLTWETIPNSNEDWSNTPAPILTNQPPQQNQRYPPPTRNQQDWQVVNRNRQAPTQQNARYPNNIPLRTQPQTQSRIPDNWTNPPQKRPSVSETRNTQEPPEADTNLPSTPQEWSPTPSPSQSLLDSPDDNSGWN